ncbi:hypothetical protein LTR08_006619 [Meristemomyces frigidus]|nr:hypothetical protein LTR08_006619 [Meristemomyces frigidus]
MDPQSQAFTPYSSNNENWRLQTDVAKIQQIQNEHTERLAKLERRQDDDARMKSVWGNSSPFPSVLSGTPQQAPQQSACDQFRGFDDEANNLMSSLHLDAEDEPRRGLGANSRANSVRFDESANQNHFSHSSRPSADFLSRTSSGLGGLQLTERSHSHKSDGRASSAHSMRSAASGRANSLNLDSGYSLGDSNRSPLDTPALAPGLLLLGAVPAIIRCWMNTNFKHDALLYAAVCTGSYRSYLDLRLIQKLGFESNISSDEEGVRTVELPVYLPEAVPHPASSRSGSPIPHLPTLTVDFQVVDIAGADTESKAIQIFIGSDILRAHSADILFSSSSMTLFDDERSKLSIPLVRPENEAAFRGLYVTSGALQTAPTSVSLAQPVKELPYLNGLGQGSSAASLSSVATSPPPGKYRPPGAIAAEAGTTAPAKAGAAGPDSEARPASQQSVASRPSLTLLDTRSEALDQQDPSTQATPLRSGSSPAIWNSWRRDAPASSAATTPQASGLEWAGASKIRDASYQRKDTGIKVLKPKTAGRTFSTASTPGAAIISPAENRSRFFDEGRRRSGFDDATPRSLVGDAKKDGLVSAVGVAAPKTKANPIGGGSAFSWLNSGGGAK